MEQLLLPHEPCICSYVVIWYECLNRLCRLCIYKLRQQQPFESFDASRISERHFPYQVHGVSSWVQVPQLVDLDHMDHMDHMG